MTIQMKAIEQYFRASGAVYYAVQDDSDFLSLWRGSLDMKVPEEFFLKALFVVTMFGQTFCEVFLFFS